MSEMYSEELKGIQIASKWITGHDKLCGQCRIAVEKSGTSDCLLHICHISKSAKLIISAVLNSMIGQFAAENNLSFKF